MSTGPALPAPSGKRYTSVEEMVRDIYQDDPEEGERLIAGMRAQPAPGAPGESVAMTATRNVLETYCEGLGLRKGMALWDLAYCVTDRLYHRPAAASTGRECWVGFRGALPCIVSDSDHNPSANYKWVRMVEAAAPAQPGGQP